MFQKIVVLEPVFISEKGLKELKKYGKSIKVYHTLAHTDEEKIKRISDADCVLVSYNTTVNKYIIDHCPNLKYIQLCCSYYGDEFCPVDLPYALSKGIQFGYLKEYGDNGVVEYILSSTISLLQGLNGKQWRQSILELSAVKVGILGLGNLGTKVAKAFNTFGAKVYYYSKTRKREQESDQLTYLPLEDLLKTVDILSLHLSRNTCLLTKDMLKLFGNNKIIINTSLGYCYDPKSLEKWLEHKKNYYICDKSSINEDQSFTELNNVIYLDRDSGVTTQTLDRATEQIINSIKLHTK